jgi:hypothetical protein
MRPTLKQNSYLYYQAINKSHNRCGKKEQEQKNTDSKSTGVLCDAQDLTGLTESNTCALRDEVEVIEERGTAL